MEKLAAKLKMLKGFSVQNIRWEGSTLQLEAIQDKKLHKDALPVSMCFIAISDCHRFQFQPLRNGSLVIEDLATINQLNLKIIDVMAQNEEVLVICSADQVYPNAILRIKAAEVQIWDEQFDPILPTGIQA